MTAVEPTEIEPAQPIGIDAFMELLSQAAEEAEGEPTPLIQGAFAMYATPQGGIMVVLNVPAGPMAGIHHQPIAPGFVRGTILLAQGDKIQALKAFGTAVIGKKAIERKAKGDK